jgi:hypothetical protein
VGPTVRIREEGQLSLVPDPITIAVKLGGKVRSDELFSDENRVGVFESLPIESGDEEIRDSVDPR